MMDRFPRRLRVAFSRPLAADSEVGPTPDEVAFVAYGDDCILSGRTVLDADRLSDMLNANDEYALVGVTVERLDDGMPLQVDEVVVARDELYLVHASGPRGDAARRRHTLPKHVAMKLGPYEVQGFLHGLPGADPVVSIRRRKPMIPLTGARIAYVVNGEPREDELDTVILNRERIEWIAVVEPDRAALPVRRPPPRPTDPKGAQSARRPSDPAPALPSGDDARPIRPAAPGPLAGLRVIDCSTVLAGPYCTMLLGDLGAEVIKVEPPEGDATRGWGPPWVGTVEAGTRTAAYFLAVNRNKRGLRLDLKTAEGAAILRRLLADADVLVENFRGDGFARLGFDDEALRALNPRLVHLAISGYGTTGPAAERPGYDFIVQAVERADVDHRRPRRRRRRPDQGRRRDQRRPDRDARRGRVARRARRARAARPAPARARASGSTSRSSGRRWPASSTRHRTRSCPGAAPGRLGNAHPNIVPYETFETADGAIAVAVGSERQWPRLCEALGLPGARRRTRGSPRTATGSRTGPRSARSWRRPSPGGRPRTGSRALDAAEIPCGPINDIVEAFASPEAVALGMTVEQEHPAFGAIRQVGLPFQLARDAGHDPDAAADPRPGHRRDPRRARLRADRDRGAPRPRGRSDAPRRAVLHAPTSGGRTTRW